MAGVRDSELLRFEGWPRGINNRAAEEAVPPDALRAAKNFDLDDDDCCVPLLPSSDDEESSSLIDERTY